MEKNNVDENVVNMNTILEEIIGGSETLVTDLLKGIRNAASGIVIIALGLYILYSNNRTGNLDNPMFVLMMILAPGSNFIVGAFNINKYIQLKSRYSRLFDLQKQLKK
ncbi:MAG: hypothetical protein NWE89_15430 [Candidatus Bathyarchaeota archaeon]|nr:hypothetical protein [Candidatus Bathyarchaeota archaeon]